jgi:hypothetical protein
MISPLVLSEHTGRRPRRAAPLPRFAHRTRLSPSTLRIFSYYDKRVGIHDSARKHGVADHDIVHVIDNALAIEDAGEDPDRWLLIGPDTAGNRSRWSS